MIRIGRLGQFSCADPARVPLNSMAPLNMTAAAAKPSAAQVRLMLLRLILPSHNARAVRAALVELSGVGDERRDASREPENAWSAFALDPLGGKSKRGNAAIDGKAIARWRAVERRGNTKDLAPPFAERYG